MMASASPATEPFTVATPRLRLRLMTDVEVAPRLMRMADGRLLGRAPDARPDWVRLEVLTADGAGIGEVGLLFQEDAPTEIGYRIAAEYRRQGFATEALRVLIAIARDAFAESELAAEAAIDNIASHRTLLRLGFAEECSAGQRWSNRRAAYIEYRRYRLASLVGAPGLLI